MQIQEIEKIVQDGVEKIQKVSDEAALEELRITYLGRKGLINDLFSGFKDVPKEEKKEYGRVVNEAKQKLEETLQIVQKTFKSALLTQRLKDETLDVTLPGRFLKAGKEHLLTQTVTAVTDIFKKMGFKIAEGPEIETEYYNFDALNIPADHPARDMHDTLYVKENAILRTHTSPVQIRVMEEFSPPLAVICPGRVYRSDAIDASHSPVFHQMEGLMVDEGISFAHLKQVLMDFVSQMFGPDTRIRFRPSYFPFTEPSAEVDISCLLCNGEGCRVCSQNGWLEILGAGMVNPRVFEMVNYDAEKYTGFAFGMGIERIAMLTCQVSDIRMFYENDVRFLEQF